MIHIISMRYPEGHKDAVREQIVETASRALRRDGLDGVTIPKIMKAVGLTHGGFYVHFKDRDALLAEAVAHAAAESGRAMDDADRPFAAYLSTEHVARPDRGCVVAALGSDGARQHGRVRKVFGEATRRLLRRVEKHLHPGADGAAISADALRAASQMVGAIVLARLVQDDELVDRLLGAARETLAD
jgi:TetR/AcrR family transcriptional repressor of nem operon